MSKLNNKVAVITGGNSGIGLAITQIFTEQNADVVIFGRNQETLEQAVKEVGNGTLAIQGDVRNSKDLDKLFGLVKEKYGKIDTPIFDRIGLPEDQIDGAKEGFASQVPMQRMAKPEEMASVALFLASEDSSYVNGADIAADGGLAQV